MTDATRSNDPEPDDQTLPDSRGEWPDWRIGTAAVARLARYVSPAHVASWVPTDLLSPLRSEAYAPQRRERVRRLYEALAARRIPYASVPWNPAAYDPEGRPAFQRIRTPAETLQGPATCLDLALTFAGMAAQADLRPLVAVRCRPTWHAAVVLELSGGMSEFTGHDHWPEPPGFVSRQGEPGVWDQEEPGGQPLARLAETTHWLPVDVVGAARDFDRDFAKASGWTITNDEEVDPADSAWALVDVRRVLIALEARGDAPYQPPLGRSVPPIHGYLPSLPGFRDFGTRSGILGGLQRLIDTGEPATLVIQAPSGYGKSMLAHRLAVGADNGCGWFLNATDIRELTRSLAQAERNEHNLGGEQPRPGGEKADATDDQAFAAAALDRLRTAQRPWVVVVDNCDSSPQTEGLLDLLPKPHAPGQVVIVTTTHPGWLAHATDITHRVELPGIGAGDLRDLRLPAGLSPAVDGRPLVALALATLRDRGGAELPESSERDGARLVWDLLRGSARAEDDVVAFARFLAWLPPEPMPGQALCKIAAVDASPGDTLAALGFVTWSLSAVSGLPADPAASGSAGLLLHRLFAAAVREQTWHDDPGAAAGTIAGLLTTDAGRWLFITAADDSALARLERSDRPDQPSGAGDAERAVRHLTGHPQPGGPPAGLLWHGLGHIRERRGPVHASCEPFARAAEALDPAKHPYQVAESRIGLARVVFQASRSTDAELEKARDEARAMRGLLARLTGPDARQLREQGNALAWLIERRLAAHEPDPAARETRLTEVRDNLWSSYAERLRIARGLSDGAPVAADAVPVLDDGLGPERAFFNLAGTNILLARLRCEIAKREAEAAGHAPAAGDEFLKAAEQSFREAERVYEVVREVRAQRYGGRPHPHLAACLHGLALVGYYRAALLGQMSGLADAAGHAAAALGQRLHVARSLAGADATAALREGDVGKSVDLLLKIITAVVLSRFGDLVSGSDTVAKAVREAIREWMDGPGRAPAEHVAPRSATLGFEHRLRVELPAAARADLDLEFAAPELIQQALTQLGSLSRVAPDIEVVQIRPSGADGVAAVRSLDVSLALPAPVSEQMGRALRWTIANAIQAPDPSWSAGPPRPEAAPATSGPPQGAAPPSPGSHRLEVRDRSTPPAPPGFVEAPPRTKPRYLSASYPDAVQPHRRFSLEAAVVLSRGSGRTEVEISDLQVGPEGRQLLLTIHAPGLAVHGDHEQPVLVPPDADSAPVRFDLEASRTGVQRIRLRAWDASTCVGELWAEVTVDDRARGGPSRTLTGEMEAEAVPGEITLEVSRDQHNGADCYYFRLRDPETEPHPEILPLRADPVADVEDLAVRLNALAEDHDSPAGIYRALRQEGIQLWDRLVPPAVHQQFWECRDRIGRLTILADNDAFPWELLYPWDQANDAGFLVEQGFPVTRRIHGFRRQLHLRRRPPRFVLPENAPPRAEDEVGALRQLLEAQEPNVATLRELQTLIDNGGFGVLHFACHGSFSRDDRGPQVHLDKPFLPRELVPPRGTWQAPLVFLNACRSAGPRYSCIGLDGFAEAFIRAGAGAFVGSLWEVRDGTAAGFARELYTSLKNGMTLGSATAELRRNAKHGDPTWLAYAVYGHPQAKVV